MARAVSRSSLTRAQQARFHSLTACVVFFLIFTPIANPRLSAQSPQATSNAAVASVNGRKITQEELDERVRPQVQALEERIYQLKNSALQALIGEVLIEQEAARRGTSVNDLIAEIVTRAQVDPTEIAAAWGNSRAQLIGVPEFEAKEQIRENLTRRRRAEAYRNFIEGLRKSAQVQIFLEPATGVRVAVDPRTDAVRGPEGALVTIIEFSDFECPYSRNAQGALERLVRENPDKLRLVFKHFPLPSHQSAFLAARASLCAQEQGRFWQYHDALFLETPPFSSHSLEMLAARLGLDRGRFVGCLKTNRHSETVYQHVRTGQAAGVSGTPTFVVNGQLYRGALTHDEWSSIVQQQLRTLAGGR